MSDVKMKMMDGNEAAASVAHRMNEVCVIYPITPSSPMGEWADAWSAAKQKNLWGVVRTCRKCSPKPVPPAHATAPCRPVL